MITHYYRATLFRQLESVVLQAVVVLTKTTIQTGETVTPFSTPVSKRRMLTAAKRIIDDADYQRTY